MKKIFLYLFIVIMIATVFASCTSQREGCWKGAEPKYRTTKMRA